MYCETRQYCSGYRRQYWLLYKNPFKSCCPKIQVLSFEPDLINYNHLCQSTKGLSNVQTHHKLFHPKLKIPFYILRESLMLRTGPTYRNNLIRK